MGYVFGGEVETLYRPAHARRGGARRRGTAARPPDGRLRPGAISVSAACRRSRRDQGVASALAITGSNAPASAAWPASLAWKSLALHINVHAHTWATFTGTTSPLYEPVSAFFVVANAFWPSATRARCFL